VDRLGREQTLRGALEKLLPGGRIFSNDLAHGRQVEIRGAYLHDPQLLIEDAHGRFYALDRKTLRPQWHFIGLPGPTDFEPATSPISVLLVHNGKMYEVERWHGDLVRSGIALDFVPSAAPAVSGSTAYFPVLATAYGSRTLVTVNLLTGLSGWGLNMSSISAKPVLGGTTSRPILFVVTQARGVYAYPADSSSSAAPEPTWAKKTHGRNVSAPVLFEDLVLVGSDRGDVTAYDEITGQVVWVHQSGSNVQRSPWGSGDQVYFTDEEGFHALSRDKGVTMWTFAEDADFLVRRPEAVYVSVGSSTVCALSPETGEVLRRVTMPIEAKFSSNMVDSIFYMVTKAGFVLSVDLPQE
jgi:outer membrane protein assembly factor BamB